MKLVRYCNRGRWRWSVSPSSFLAQLSYSDADSRGGCRTIAQHSDPPIFLSSYSCNVRGNDTPKTVREMPVPSKSILCPPHHGLAKRYDSPIHRAQNLPMKRRFCVRAGVRGVFLVENARKFWRSRRGCSVGGKSSGTAALGGRPRTDGG